MSQVSQTSRLLPYFLCVLYVSCRTSQRKSRPLNESDDDSSDGDEDLASDLDRASFVDVGRVMLRCIDMFANMQKVIKVNVYLKEEEDAKDCDDDDTDAEEEDETDRVRRQEYLLEL